jgi:hypothetical protein
VLAAGATFAAGRLMKKTPAAAAITIAMTAIRTRGSLDRVSLLGTCF